MDSKRRQAFTCFLTRMIVNSPVEFIIFTVRDETDTTWIGERVTADWAPMKTEELSKFLWKREGEMS